jgi:hypothetical protein
MPILTNSIDSVPGVLGTVFTSNSPTTQPSWIDVGLKNIVVYTSGSGTYNPSNGITSILVQGVGGGGGGGGSNFTGTGVGNGSAAGGGGAGGYFCIFIPLASLAASYAYVIGAGGTSAAAQAGGNGGNTTFTTVQGTLVGGGGVGAVAGYTGVLSQGSTPGGIGGGFSNPYVAPCGSYGISGGDGSPSVCLGPSQVIGFFSSIPGNGGSSVFGEGGVTQNLLLAPGGSNGKGYGSGGSGAICYTLNNNKAGGSGASGIIIIYEYV